MNVFSGMMIFLPAIAMMLAIEAAMPITLTVTLAPEARSAL